MRPLRGYARVAGLLIAVVVGGVSRAGASGAPRSSRCRPPLVDVLASDRKAVLYTAPVPGADELFVWGCTPTSGKVRLGLQAQECSADGGCFGITREALGGTVVAYERFFVPGILALPGVDPEAFVGIRDLRHPRMRRRYPTGNGRVSDLVVASTGVVAWTTERSIGVEPEVRAVDRTGSRVISTGPGVDPKSLALTGTTLYWTEHGIPQSVSLH
jgi:hypothetical protein